MTLTKTARTIVASTVNSAAGTTRGRLDLNAAQGGGYLTIKITNGGTGPAVQCQANILIAHSSTLPAPASAGADWKTLASYGGGTATNAVTEIGMPIDPAIMVLEVEFTGNTSQAVTVEAFFSELTSVA
jgi:hypothetical protein